MGRRGLIFIVLTTLLTLSSGVGSGAQVETGADAVSAEKAGWWNSLQGIESGTPAAPIGGVYPGFPQQATGVPIGDFASGMRAGEVDKLAAIGILVDAPLGATVEEFTMTLTESADPAANNGSAEVAAITACPIVAYWVEVENGRFNGRPEADCNLAAIPGVRDAEGRWKFDLKLYGNAVLSTSTTFGQNGVLLMPTGAPPETFQVTWAGLASKTPPTFTFRATGGDPPADELGGGGGFGEVGSADSGFGSDFGATTFDDVRTDSSFDTGDSGVDLGAAQEPPAADVGAPEAPVPSEGAGLGREIGNIAGNLPPFTLPAFLFLLALMAAVGLMLGRPLDADEVLNRRGGVSRALATRRATKTTLEAT